MSGHGSKKEEKESPSLIPLIADKEREFEKILTEAEAKAQSIVAEAEAETGRIIAGAKKAAQQESEAALGRGEKEIEQEVAGILKAGQDEARKLKISLSAKIPEAAKTVTEFILPNGKHPS